MYKQVFDLILPAVLTATSSLDIGYILERFKEEAGHYCTCHKRSMPTPYKSASRRMHF
jgi:hypothetical protein